MISRNTATLNPSGILPLPVSWLWNSTSSEKFEIGYFSGSSKRNATFQNLKISVPGGFSQPDKHIFFWKDFGGIKNPTEFGKFTQPFVTQVPSQINKRWISQPVTSNKTKEVMAARTVHTSRTSRTQGWGFLHSECGRYPNNNPPIRWKLCV